MAASFFKFRAVIRISAVDLIGTLGDAVSMRKKAELCWVLSGKILAYNSVEKSSMATNRYSRGSIADCPFSKGSRLVSK